MLYKQMLSISDATCQNERLKCQDLLALRWFVSALRNRRVALKARLVIAIWLAWSLKLDFPRVFSGSARSLRLQKKHLSATAQEHVSELLAEGHDTDLVSIANWADDVRVAAAGRGPLRDDPEARAFNEEFPTNALWHSEESVTRCEAF